MKCVWCGAPFSVGSARKRCCSGSCVNALHNLRKTRGDQIYDLLMVRAESYLNRSLLTEIDRMVRQWRADDKAAGRVTHKREHMGGYQTTGRPELRTYAPPTDTLYKVKGTIE